jgi:hypothetical protein
MPALACDKCGPSGQAKIYGAMFAQAGDPDLDNGAPLYQVDFGPWRGRAFVDFDASSGLMCGNSWGQPSKQAEIAYNIMSLNAPHPIIRDRGIHTRLTSLLFYQNGGSPTSTAWQNNMQTNSSACLGKRAARTLWDAEGVYVGGWMGNYYWDGPTWDYLCRWCHYGDTYGYTSLTQFFAGKDSRFRGFLAQRDVVFVVVSNADNLGPPEDPSPPKGDPGDAQAPYDTALAHLIKRLTRKVDAPIATDADLVAAMRQAMVHAYSAMVSMPGLTATIGYFFIGSDGPHRGSCTVSVIGGKVVTPTTEYPFRTAQGVRYLGADGPQGQEPAYYYGSGTKPLSAALTVQALSAAWLANHPGGSAAQFVEWYVGAGVVTSPTSGKEFLSTFGAATMRDVLAMKGQSYYSETIPRWLSWGDPANVGAPPRGTPATFPIQQWYLKIYGADACTTWRGLSQQAGNCPSNQCLEIDWANTTTPPLPGPRSNCACAPMPVADLLPNFLDHLSPVALSCMQGGVTDADSVIASNKGLLPGDSDPMDFIDQALLRADAIGPMNFLRGAIGLNWYPGYKGRTTPRSANYENDWISPGQYTSSGFTLLGSLLWVFDPRGPKSPEAARNWTEIDINASFFPPALASLNHFAGTSGNGGASFFVPAGGVPQKGVLSGCNVSNARRADCMGARGADPAVCLANPDCCYMPSIVTQDGAPLPWCYRRAPPPGSR